MLVPESSPINLSLSSIPIYFKKCSIIYCTYVIFIERLLNVDFFQFDLGLFSSDLLLVWDINFIKLFFFRKYIYYTCFYIIWSIFFIKNTMGYLTIHILMPFPYKLNKLTNNGIWCNLKTSINRTIILFTSVSLDNNDNLKKFISQHILYNNK